MDTMSPTAEMDDSPDKPRRGRRKPRQQAAPGTSAANPVVNPAAKAAEATEAAAERDEATPVDELSAGELEEPFFASILVPQADTLEHVKKVTSLVAAGHSGTDELSASLSYVGRQGQFYRRAAVQMGMLQEVGRSYSVTPLGHRLIATSDPKVLKMTMRKGFMQNPALKAAFAFVEGNAEGRTRGELALWLEQNTQMNATTSRRRVQSVINWMCELGLAYISGGRFGRIVAYSRTPYPVDDKS